MTIGVATGHAAAIMLDRSKGSMTNRAQCAKEHFKNDMKTGLKLWAVGGAGVGTVYAVKNSAKAAKAVKTSATYLGKVLGKLATKLGASKLGAKILAHAPKAGVAAIAIAAGAYVLDTIVGHANKAGRIDQKYEDSAKIEATTKNVVLDA